MHTQEKEFKQKVLTAVTVPKVLTSSQCELVIHDAIQIGMKRAPVLAKDGTHVRSWNRTCASCWVPKSSLFEWLYNYVAAVTDEVNRQHYQFDITDMQQLQVLRYRPGQWFRWHFDAIESQKDIRKMTMVINLSPACGYIGGGLQVDGNWHNHEQAREQGSASFFPAWMKHRAKAPIWGTRWVLVAWITGPAWR
jgi:PKHD-type hydroxylase